MNRHNAKMNAFALQQLQLIPSDRILEIGFGGGINLPSFFAVAEFAVGVDRSEDVVKRARLKFSEAVSAGRADFQVGSVEALPFGTGTFRKVCTVNTVYFWSSLDRGFADIRRVLTPGGRVIVGFLPKHYMDKMKFPTDIFTTRTTDDVVAAIGKAGFSNIQITRPLPTTPWNVIVATS